MVLLFGVAVQGSRLPLVAIISGSQLTGVAAEATDGGQVVRPNFLSWRFFLYSSPSALPWLLVQASRAVWDTPVFVEARSKTGTWRWMAG